MRNSDRIRHHGRERYVLPAKNRGDRRFSIRVGDVVRALGLIGRVPAVCSALKTGKFLEQNNLQLVATVAPKSGQSTTVTYTYQFLDSGSQPEAKGNAFKRLRGALKDIFAELGGGEAYLRAERGGFYPSEENK